MVARGVGLRGGAEGSIKEGGLVLTGAGIAIEGECLEDSPARFPVHHAMLSAASDKMSWKIVLRIEDALLNHELVLMFKMIGDLGKMADNLRP